MPDTAARSGGRYTSLQRTGRRYDSKRQRRSSETLLDNDLLASLRADVDFLQLLLADGLPVLRCPN